MNTNIFRRIFTAGVMTGTSVLTSPGTRLAGRRTVSVQAVWTGTPNGTFNFQVTDHPLPYLDASSRPTAVITTTDNTAATWTSLTNPTAFQVLQPAGAAGSAEFGFADVGGAFFRVKYTNASSTGAVDCWLSAR